MALVGGRDPDHMLVEIILTHPATKPGPQHAFPLFFAPAPALAGDHENAPVAAAARFKKKPVKRGARRRLIVPVEVECRIDRQPSTARLTLHTRVAGAERIAGGRGWRAPESAGNRLAGRAMRSNRRRMLPHDIRGFSLAPPNAQRRDIAHGPAPQIALLRGEPALHCAGAPPLSRSTTAAGTST